MKRYPDYARFDRSRKSPDAMKVIAALVTECSNPARYLELYYWSVEPNLAEIMRAIAGMSPETRDLLACYMRGVIAPEDVTADVRADGQLVLTRPETPDHLVDVVVIGDTAKTLPRALRSSRSRRFRPSAKTVRLGRSKPSRPAGSAHEPQKAAAD